MLEYFVHLDADDPPNDLVLATVDIPDDLLREQIDPDELPTNWCETPAPPELARMGDDFVAKAKHCLLIVPSVLAKTEKNWLLNPRHPDFQKVAIRDLEPLSYDARMFAPAKHRVKHKSK